MLLSQSYSFSKNLKLFEPSRRVVRSGKKIYSKVVEQFFSHLFDKQKEMSGHTHGRAKKRERAMVIEDGELCVCAQSVGKEIAERNNGINEWIRNNLQLC